MSKAVSVLKRIMVIEPRHLLAALLGALFALALHEIWVLEGRWFYVTVAAIVMISISLMFIGIFSDFLMVALMFCIPLAGFGKWFFPSDLRDLVFSSPKHNATLEGTLGVGLIDFILVGLYASWFFRIFVLREERLPRLNSLDAFAGIFLVAYVISIPGAPTPALGVYATAYLAKFLLLYFYISRNFKERHLAWLIASFVFAVALEGSFGVIQYTTGKLVGLGLDKGSGGQLGFQYIVPGTENWSRATGTTYDSHTLGLYLSMLIPFLFFLYFAPKFRFELRFLFAGILAFALAVLIMTFTRSGWVACAVSMSFAVFLMLFVWRDGRLVPFLFVAFFIFLLSSPWSLKTIYDRFELSPIETLTVRLDGFEVALNIWAKNLIFGSGAGNYMELLYRYGYGWTNDVIVHNTILWIGSETGIIGLIGFYGAVIAAMRRYWRLAMEPPRDLIAYVGFGAFIALVAFVTEGMATPMHREPTTYTMFWYLIGLSVALTSIRTSQAAQNASAA